MPRTADESGDDDRREHPENEQPRGDLDFHETGREGRVGDRRSDRELAEEFPARREREAGRTGGEMRGVNAADDDVTADDAAPETLLDEDTSHTPDAAGREPLDQGLRETSFAADLGLGHGRDEQELAEAQPVGRVEAERLAEKAREHARDANAFEPAERDEARSQQQQESARRPATTKKSKPAR